MSVRVAAITNRATFVLIQEPAQDAVRAEEHFIGEVDDLEFDDDSARFYLSALLMGLA
jgi:hypothetical protein